MICERRLADPTASAWAARYRDMRQCRGLPPWCPRL